MAPVSVDTHMKQISGFAGKIWRLRLRHKTVSGVCLRIFHELVYAGPGAGTSLRARTVGYLIRIPLPDRVSVDVHGNSAGEKHLRGKILAVSAASGIVGPRIVSFIHISVRVGRRSLPVISVLRLQLPRFPFPVRLSLLKLLLRQSEIFRNRLRVSERRFLSAALTPEHHINRIKHHMASDFPASFHLFQFEQMIAAITLRSDLRILIKVLDVILSGKNVQRTVLLLCDFVQSKRVAPGSERIVRILHLPQADLEIDGTVRKSRLFLI